MKKRLETLTRAHGVSGDESAIRAAIRQAAEPYADDITEDALGNLIVHQKGAGKKIMLAAHMDSVGVIVTHIEQNGFLRFGAIGGLEAKGVCIRLWCGSRMVPWGSSPWRRAKRRRSSS